MPAKPMDQIDSSAPSWASVLNAEMASFISHFMSQKHNRVLQHLMLAARPELTGDVYIDAYIAAAGEHLALISGLANPEWTIEPTRKGPDLPMFSHRHRSAMPVIGVTPPAFRKRNILTDADPLDIADRPVLKSA